MDLIINYVYSPIHHQCLYKYSVLLLYWVRRKREHASIYAGDNNPGSSPSSNDTNITNFDYESTLTAVGSVGNIPLLYSEFIQVESRLNVDLKSIPKHAQSIMK